MKIQKTIDYVVIIGRWLNRGIRKIWQNFRKIIFNKDYLIVFVAASMVFVNLVIFISFIYNSKILFKSITPTVNLTSIVEEKTKNEEQILTENSTEKSEQNCNVRGIELRGDIVTFISQANKDKDGNQLADETSSENVVGAINIAEADQNIKAIVLEVDSYGGSPVGAEEIANALKKVTKPTAVFVRSAATSAAYWSSTGANIIFASNLSDIGGIGVTMSYIDNSKKNIKDGLTYNSLSAGKYKDYGSPDKAITNEERALMMRDISIIHDNFIKAVAINRNLDINKVKKLADGSSMPGQIAIENGLIDRIGGLLEVENYLKEKIGEDVSVCW